MPDLNDQENQDLWLLLALLDKIEPWIKAMSADDGDPSWPCAVQARSPLFGDDRRCGCRNSSAPLTCCFISRVEEPIRST